MYAVVGMAERNNGKIFNSAILFGPEGKIIGVYRKVHLWSTETVYFAHGSEYPVFDTDFGKMGMWICYDTRFPEVARSYAIQGARIAFISTAWLARDIEHWKLAVSSRAMDN
ncbi:MAG: carbon-nitrogen hydrolase family protein, partial [Candidatus Atribacteria bacterium]|nr:carbon-nitrogen hydrolase family protein [Candidatus Atribacteria bacterium]